MDDTVKNWQVALVGIPLGLVFGAVIPYLLSLLDCYPLEVQIGAVRWLGIPMVVGGIAVAVYSVIYLQRRCGGMTAPTQGRAATRLVNTGPYAVIRHPQQAGYLLLLFGMSVALSSPLAFIYALLSTLAVVIYQRQVEEPRMLERHGEEYAQYRCRVPQLFPRLRLGGKDWKKHAQ